MTGLACDRALGQGNLSADLSDIYSTDDALDIDELQELIYTYQDNPLVWEKCRIKDLRTLPLNDYLKNRLIELKRRHPKSVDRLVLGLDTVFTTAELEVIQKCINFAAIPTTPGQILNFISLRKQENTTSLQKSLQRVRYHSRQGWFGGLILENDRDEPCLWDYRNFSLRSPQYFNRLDLWGGAYRLQWGQGLLFSNNLMSSRSTNVIGNLNTSRNGFGNYLGSDENRYLFGAASNLTIGHLGLGAFYSNHKLDATIDQSGLVTNLRSDGLHVSASQLQAKAILSETLAGISLLVSWYLGSAGFLFYTADYSHPLVMLDAHQNISGISFLHNCEINDWTISGELAVQGNRIRALIENFCIDLERFSLGVGWRHFEPDFFARLGSPFRQFGGLPSNERGLYCGLKAKLPDHWYCGFYVDFFREIENPGDGTSAQSGMESLLGISHTAKSGGTVEAWYRNKQYYQLDILPKPSDHQLKLHFRHHFTSVFAGELRATFRWNGSTHFAEGGQAIGLVGRLAISNDTRLTAGLTHFFVKSSNLMVYFYEPGLPLRFNLNNLTGTGRNYVLVITRKIGQKCELAASARGETSSPVSKVDSNREVSGDLQLTFDL